MHHTIRETIGLEKKKQPLLCRHIQTQNFSPGDNVYARRGLTDSTNVCHFDTSKTQLQDTVARPASTCTICVDLKLVKIVKVAPQSIVFLSLSLHGFGSVLIYEHRKWTLNMPPL